MEGANTLGLRIPFQANLPLVVTEVLEKGGVGETRDVYITLLASDTEVDYQGDRMDYRVLYKVAEDAKRGKITLRRHHSDSFYIAESVDGEVRTSPNNLAQLYITFKAVKLGDTYYPEVLHIIQMHKEKGQIPIQASVGGWITKYSTTILKGRPIRIIEDAIVDHVALTPLEGAVNPRTFVKDILVKSLVEAIDTFERQGGIAMLQEPTIVETTKPTLRGKERILQDLEKCGIERRRIAYTRYDIDALKERVARWGINPSPMGNIVKPDIYIDFRPEEFADPVNFLFPLQKDYVADAIDFAKTMSTTFLAIYDTPSAKIVYSRLVKSALEMGVPVEFTGSPVDALLDEDLASQLPGYRPDIYRVLKSWVENLEDYYIKIAAGLWDEVIDASDSERLREELLQRAEKYGYLPIPLAKAKPHPMFEGWSPRKFADPVGYLFPITPEWVLFSYKAFINTPVREFYTPTGKKFVYERILKGLERIGALVVFDPSFELNWYFADSPVFVGADEYLDDVEEMKKSISERWEFTSTQYTTLSAILWGQPAPAATTGFAKASLEEEIEKRGLRDLVELFIEAERKAEEEEEKEEKLEKSDYTVTVQDAPMFPFVIPPTSTLRRRRGDKDKLVTVFPNLIKFESGEKEGKTLPQEVLTLREIVKRFGLNEVPEIKSGEVKLRWVGPKGVATPVVVLDGKRKVEDVGDVKNPAVGFTVWGGVQAIKKGKVLAEWIVFNDGTVAAVYNLPLLPTSMLIPLKKDDTPLLDLRLHLQKLLAETFNVENPIVEAIGVATIVWSAMEAKEGCHSPCLYISPYRIEDGKIVVEPVKVRAACHYTPEGEGSEAELFSLHVRALRRAGASEEWEQWVSQFVEVVPVEEVEEVEVEEEEVPPAEEVEEITEVGEEGEEEEFAKEPFATIEGDTDAWGGETEEELVEEFPPEEKTWEEEWEGEIEVMEDEGIRLRAGGDASDSEAKKEGGGERLLSPLLRLALAAQEVEEEEEE